MFRLILIYLLLIFSFNTSVFSNNVRAMWVVRYALTDVSQTENIINTAKALDITDLYIQVRALGKSYGYTATKNSDEPLTKIISHAHQENIRVHAWLNCLYIWSGNQPPDEAGHIYNKSTNSFLRRAKDDDIPNYSNYKEKGIEGYFIDPLSNDNLLELKMVISTMINTYHVDGIHLDYFRYPSVEYSFSPMGRKQFFLENWYDPVFLFNNDSFLNDIVSQTNRSRQVNEYVKFLQKNLTSLLQNIQNYIIKLDSDTELSIAVKPDLKKAKSDYIQDWDIWLKQGICDRIVLMNYQTDYEQFRANLLLSDKLKQNDKIIVGVSTYNQDYNAVTKRIELIKNMQFLGYSLFSYNFLKKNNYYLNRLIISARESK